LHLGGRAPNRSLGIAARLGGDRNHKIGSGGKSMRPTAGDFKADSTSHSGPSNRDLGPRQRQWPNRENT
jgi:hypothetical protein